MTTSIIIVTHNKLDMTRRCIDSIRKHTERGRYEIVAVDNGSTDGTVEWLGEQDDVLLIARPDNLGFPSGCNAGVAAATGERLLLLNNDTVVTPRWLEQLERALASDPAVGAVGPVTNFAGYGQTVETTYRTPEELERFADIYNVSSPRRWEQRLKLIGFCLLTTRDVWNKVGDMDESFGIGNFEDDDWCVRARLAGYKLLLCKDTFVHHEGHATFRATGDSYERTIRLNEQLFGRKWGFHPHLATNVRDDLLAASDGLAPGATVLDIGCGCGGTLLEVLNRSPGARLFGFEPNERAAKVAALIAENVWTREQDIRLPEGHGGFDLIVWNNLEPISAPLPVLHRLRELLRPGGVLAASVPNRLYADFVRMYLEPVNRVAREGPMSKEETRRRFVEAGFAEIELLPTSSGRHDEEAIAALRKLAGAEREEEFMAMYYVVRAVRARIAPLPFPPSGGDSRADEGGLRTSAHEAYANDEGSAEPGADLGGRRRHAGPRPAAERSLRDRGRGDGRREPLVKVSAVQPDRPISAPVLLPKAQEDVAFTGERLVLNSAISGSHPDVFAEHIYRYRLAQTFCAGQLVLDAACGTGYGTRMLKDAGATGVVGVDIDAASIALAQRDYIGPDVGFLVGNVLNLPYPDGTFDVVVSFETIEHVPDGAAWLREAARVLKPGGRLIVSTPNREVTNPDRLFGQPMRNPYHTFEYTLGEFVGELTALYDIEGLFGQTFVGPSGLTPPEWSDIVAALGGNAALASPPGMNPELMRHYAVAPLQRIKNARPAFVTAVCRKKPVG